MSCWQVYWLALRLPFILATNQNHVAHSQPRFNFKHRLNQLLLQLDVKPGSFPLCAIFLHHLSNTIFWYTVWVKFTVLHLHLWYIKPVTWDSTVDLSERGFVLAFSYKHMWYAKKPTLSQLTGPFQTRPQCMHHIWEARRGATLNCLVNFSSAWRGSGDSSNRPIIKISRV